MHIEFRPWARRASGEGTIEHQTVAAMLIRMEVEKKGSWTPKAAVCNLGEIMEKLRSLEALSQTVKADDTEQTFHTKPWAHQLRGWKYVSEMWASGAGCLLEYGMGSGKTKISIDVLSTTPDCSPILIVCPLSVVANWPKQFAIHSAPGEFAVIGLDKYSISKRAEIAEAHIRKYAGTKTKSVIIINYDSVWREDFAPALAGIKTIIADEVHKIKSYNGAAAKFMGRMSPKVKYRIGLSGTPCPQGPLDVFGVFRFIEPSLFGTRWTPFKSRYAQLGGYMGKVVVGYQNEDELRKKYLSRTLQCSRDVLDLPEATHIQRIVQLTGQTLKIYRDMEKTFVAEVESGVVTAANAMVSLLRLAQITGGAVPVENGTGIRIGTEKQENLEDILDSLAPTEPVVVFCRFRADLDAVHLSARNMERGSLELSGRRNELAQWQSGGAPVLAVQIQAGGVGIDLTRACYVVYWSVDFSLGNYLQSEARAHRPGQDRPVTFFHIVADNTIDEKIYAALENKKDIIESIIGEIKH